MSNHPILFETFHCRLVFFFTGTAMSCQRRSHGFKVIYVKCSTSGKPRIINKTRGYKARNLAKKQRWQPRSIKHLLKSKMMAHNMGNGASFCHSVHVFWAHLTWATIARSCARLAPQNRVPTQSTCLYSSSAYHAKTKLRTAAEAEKVLFWSKLWTFASLATCHFHHLQPAPCGRENLRHRCWEATPPPHLSKALDFEIFIPFHFPPSKNYSWKTQKVSKIPGFQCDFVERRRLLRDSNAYLNCKNSSLNIAHKSEPNMNWNRV